MSNEYAPSTVESKKFVKHMLGFGVGVGLGLAPLLGKLHIPGFSGLLELFPDDLQQVSIPLSSFLMGCVAVAVQFFVAERMRKRLLLSSFRLTFMAMVVLLFGLIFLQFKYVLSVPVQGGAAKVAVVIGSERLPGCGCEQNSSDEQCIRELSFQPGAIESCWGSAQVRRNKFFLVLFYLTTTACFGALIGLVLIKDSKKDSKTRAAKHLDKGEPPEKAAPAGPK